MKNNAVLTNPLRRKRFEVGDRYLIHVAQDGEEYAVHHTTLDPATWVIVTSITDTAVTDQHPIEARWLNSESRWLNSRGVDDFIPYPLRNVFTAGDWRSAVAIDPSPCCCVRLGNVEHCATFDHMPPAVELNDVHVRTFMRFLLNTGPGTAISPLHTLGARLLALALRGHRPFGHLFTVHQLAQVRLRFRESRVGPDLCHMGIRGGGAGPVPRPFGGTRFAG